MLGRGQGHERKREENEEDEILLENLISAD